LVLRRKTSYLVESKIRMSVALRVPIENLYRTESENYRRFDKSTSPISLIERPTIELSRV
jgi:hypothetical protein